MAWEATTHRLTAPNIVDRHNGIHSVYPCTHYLTFGPWIYLVPQYKPDNVLMLGYGGGTAAGLIRLFYGDVPITAVDIEDCSHLNWYDVDLVQADAAEYVKDCDFFDAIIVDCFGSDPGSLEPPAFVFSREFVANVEQRCNYLIVDATEWSDMSAYEHLHRVKTLALNHNRFHYYAVNRIPGLPIR